MMAWMNKESLKKTLEIGETVFWSRSRKELWHKGAASGHTQKVKDIAFDCDKDVLLIQVEQSGAACHEGYKSCFFRSIVDGEVKVTEPRLVDPEKGVWEEMRTAPVCHPERSEGPLNVCSRADIRCRGSFAFGSE